MKYNRCQFDYLLLSKHINMHQYHEYKLYLCFYNLLSILSFSLLMCIGSLIEIGRIFMILIEIPISIKPTIHIKNDNARIDKRVQEHRQLQLSQKLLKLNLWIVSSHNLVILVFIYSIPSRKKRSDSLAVNQPCDLNTNVHSSHSL